MDSVLAERRATFCARLKAARETKGVSHDQIAATTKISRSLFRGLENSDLSRWPKGLYRRAYLRSYLNAIDVPPEPVVAEFLRLFPDEDAPPVAGAIADGPEVPPALSMTLADTRTERLARARKRMLAAAIDVAVVLVVCGAASWVLQADVRTSGTVVALGYYSIATAALGRSFGSRWLENRRWMRSKRPRLLPASPTALLARLRTKGRAGLLDRQDAEGAPGAPWNATLFRFLFFR